MPHSHTSLIIHYVFSPLSRYRINNPDTRKHLNTYICGICHNLECEVLASYVMPDHVRLLVRIPAKLAVSELVKKVKANSARHLNTQADRPYRFVWQEGYGAFTCSFSNVKQAVEYIHNQERHHQAYGYSDEYQTLLIKHHIDHEVPS